MYVTHFMCHHSPTNICDYNALCHPGHVKECTQYKQCVRPLSANAALRPPAYDMRAQRDERHSKHTARLHAGSSQQCDQPRTVTANDVITEK